MIPSQLRTRLAAIALVLPSAVVAGGSAYLYSGDRYVPAEVVVAMEIGSYYESGGRHIGTPYIDKLGKGQPLTVCAGVTGAGVVAGRYYTEADCRRLELPRYMRVYAQTRQMFTHYSSYDTWARASWIDAVWNLGAGAVAGSSMLRMANTGNAAGACEAQKAWVLGTVNGVKKRLTGLINRRSTTRDLCIGDIDFSLSETCRDAALAVAAAFRHLLFCVVAA